MPNMPHLDPLNHILKDIRCQYLDGYILADRGIDLPPLHASGKCPYLIQHIGVQHLVVNNVSLGAGLRMPVVVGA